MSRLTTTIAILAVLMLWEPLIAAPNTFWGGSIPGLLLQVNQNTSQVNQKTSQNFGQVSSSTKANRVVHDIRLKQDNFFRGQLPPDAFPKSERQVRIRFFRNNRLIAETKADSKGRFTLRYLPTGTGVLAVSAKGATKICFCRLWSPGTAPPLRINPNEPKTSVTARAQGLHVFPSMSFQQVATTLGVVGGAIATPVMWHNIQQDHKAPISGS